MLLILEILFCAALLSAVIALLRMIYQDVMEREYTSAFFSVTFIFLLAGVAIAGFWGFEEARGITWMP